MLGATVIRGGTHHFTCEGANDRKGTLRPYTPPDSTGGLSTGTPPRCVTRPRSHSPHREAYRACRTASGTGTTRGRLRASRLRDRNGSDLNVRIYIPSSPPLSVYPYLSRLPCLSFSLSLSLSFSLLRWHSIPSAFLLRRIIDCYSWSRCETSTLNSDLSPPPPLPLGERKLWESK